MTMCENVRERFLLRGVVVVRRRLVVLIQIRVFVGVFEALDIVEPW
jgi:hypothetical protein